jgi:hypothetical protein
MRARKAGASADERRTVKPAHAKPRAAKPERGNGKPNAPPHKEDPGSGSKKAAPVPVVSASNVGVPPSPRPEPTVAQPAASTPPRGTPPPLPAPIASFTF